MTKLERGDANTLKNKEFEGAVPSLVGAVPASFDLMASYWTPEAEGEFRDCWFIGMGEEFWPSMKTGELENVKTAKFVWENPETGNWETFSNSTSEILSLFQNIPIRTSYRLVFSGKKKNKTNSLYRFTFSVYPLRLVEQK